MKIGIIGLGNIGTMLSDRFAKNFVPTNLIVFDKKKNKNKQYTFVNSSQEVVDQSDVVFLCIRPQNLQAFFLEITPGKKIFITTVASIYQDTYYKHLGEINLIRIIPSMLNQIGGPILFCPGKYISKNNINKVKKILLNVGKIHEVREKELDAFTHLSSCSPAIITEFLRLYITTLQEEHPLNKKQSLLVLNETLKILVELLEKEGFDVVKKVSTKGGITEQGINIMNKHKDDFFKELTTTLLERMKEVRKQYGK